MEPQAASNSADEAGMVAPHGGKASQGGKASHGGKASQGRGSAQAQGLEASTSGGQASPRASHEPGKAPRGPSIADIVGKVTDGLFESAEAVRRGARRIGELLDDQARLIDLQDELLDHGEEILGLMARGSHLLALIRSRLERGDFDASAPSDSEGSRDWLTATLAEVEVKQKKLHGDLLWLHGQAVKVREQQDTLAEQTRQQVAELERLDLRHLARADEAAAELLHVRDQLRNRSVGRHGTWDPEIFRIAHLVDVLLRRVLVQGVRRAS